MTACVRTCVALVCLSLSAASLTANNPPSSDKSPAKKAAPPTLKDIEANPGNFLGNRLTIPAMLGPTSKSSGTGAELSVYVDAKTPANRVRFLAAKSLADSVGQFIEIRRVILKGTVLAAESVRAGYSFEVEEISVVDDCDAIVTTLKPAAGPLPTFETVENKEHEPAKEKEAAKPAEPVKKGGIPPALAVGAALMAVLLAILGVVGIRLMKYLKKKPAKSQPRPVEKAMNGVV